MNPARAQSLADFSAGVAPLVRGIIKGANHIQTDELCALFSQTNKWDDFERDVQETGMSV